MSAMQWGGRGNAVMEDNKLTAVIAVQGRKYSETTKKNHKKKIIKKN